MSVLGGPPLPLLAFALPVGMCVPGEGRDAGMEWVWAFSSGLLQVAGAVLWLGVSVHSQHKQAVVSSAHFTEDHSPINIHL